MPRARQIVFLLEDSSKSKFGGGQAISLKVMAVLCRRYEVVLFDGAEETRFTREAKPFTSRKVSLHTSGRIASGKRFDPHLLLERLGFPLEALRNLAILRRELRRVRGRQVVLFPATKKTLILAWAAHVLWGAPFVFHAHTYDSPASFTFPLRRMMYRRADRILCVTRFVMDGLNLPNTTLLYNPVALPARAKAKRLGPKKPIVVAAFSRLIPQKGLEYLMMSHRHLPAEMQERVRIRIFGDGPYRQALSAHAGPKVSLEGFCEKMEGMIRDEVAISVVPSVILESFGLTTIESFRYGVPVICTNQGGPAELVTDGVDGFHVPIRDARAIARRIERLASDPALYSRFSRNAIRASRRFGLDAFANDLDAHARRVFSSIKERRAAIQP
jgi:glycosyltransferase involved in cell wall biosynthesis